MTINPFTKPNLILVEGPTDAAFFRHLIEVRKLPENFNVRSPRDALGEAGVTRFAEALDAFVVEPTFRKVQHIIVVGDNDEHPVRSLETIQRQLQKTDRKYTVPKTPRVKTKGKAPHVTILMLPGTDQHGCLETLCLRAAMETNPELGKCVTALGQCASTDKWPASKRAKSDLRCLIASAYQRNPDESLSFIWDNFPEFIPLRHAVFDDVAKFLANI